MRTRTTILVAALSAAALAGGVAPAAAESDQAAAARAVTGRLHAAPRAEALVNHVPVRVVVRVPARTSRLRVRVGRRDVTSSFRRARGSRRVARLTRRDGLRYGPNRLFVMAHRRGGRPVVDARSFVLARRHRRLVRLRVHTGPVTTLSVRVAGKAFLAPEHFQQPGEVEKRLSVIRRSRTARLWLNGRRVTRVLDRSRPTRWTAKLSATHGLRHGVNRLRLLVAEPGTGRYVVLRRRFLVPRNRHLAAAGWDAATTVAGRVRLDGRRSKLAGGGRARHSWRILAKPPGPRASCAAPARPVRFSRPTARVATWSV